MAGPVIAVDFGRSKIAAALVDDQLALLDRRQQDVRGIDDVEELVELIIAQAWSMSRDHPEAAAIGISFAGDVAAGKGLVYWREVIAGDRGHAGRGRQRQLNLASLVEARCQLPVSVENDGAAATLAEWKAGAASGYDNVVCFTIGTHIGSGLVADGQLVHRRTSSPSLGTILAKDGDELVIVGDRCSGSGVARLAQERGLPADAKQVAELAQAGDLQALAVVEEAGYWLGILLASAGNVYDPDVIVLGGGVMAGLGKMMLAAAQPVLTSSVAFAGFSDRSIVFARFGAEAGLIGAALNSRALAAPHQAKNS